MILDIYAHERMISIDDWVSPSLATREEKLSFIKHVEHSDSCWIFPKHDDDEDETHVIQNCVLENLMATFFHSREL